MSHVTYLIMHVNDLNRHVMSCRRWLQLVSEENFVLLGKIPLFPIREKRKIRHKKKLKLVYFGSRQRGP